MGRRRHDIETRAIPSQIDILEAAMGRQRLEDAAARLQLKIRRAEAVPGEFNPSRHRLTNDLPHTHTLAVPRGSPAAFPAEAEPCAPRDSLSSDEETTSAGLSMPWLDDSHGSVASGEDMSQQSSMGPGAWPIGDEEHAWAEYPHLDHYFPPSACPSKPSASAAGGALGALTHGTGGGAPREEAREIDIDVPDYSFLFTEARAAKLEGKGKPRMVPRYGEEMADVPTKRVEVYLPPPSPPASPDRRFNCCLPRLCGRG
eukprot:TRINITY_DN22633_c0_g1_i1.p1 TRINITY_DN22633_c0_g1~~TRINITY_DN22633_c0_g1_i1.p1  ORF type:complete len:258 (-),score=-25.57 TRINITY_DN22633_c0_g1_i1:349-1122(-)